MMTGAIKLIQGEKHIDNRGGLLYFNEFNVAPIKRFYIVEPSSQNVRAWQGHKREQKWFYVLAGTFKIVLIKPDNWERPSPRLDYQEFIISSDSNQILHIPGGYLNGFIPYVSNSRLMVFSDFTLKESSEDDFRFDKDLWYNW